MTSAQRLNLDSAIRLAMEQIGRPGQNPAALPYALKEPYTKALALIIVSNPTRFDEQTVSSARLEMNDRPDGALGGYTFGEAIRDGLGSVADTASNLNPTPQLFDSLKTLLKWAPLIIGAGVLLWFFASGRNSSVRIKN